MLGVGHVEIEVAAQDAGRRDHLPSIGLARVGGMPIGGRLLLQIQQPPDLRVALRRRIILQMRVGDAQRPEGCLHGDLERLAPHAAHRIILRPGQKVTGDLQDRQARQRHVAEAMGLALAVDRFDRRAKHGTMIRQQRGKLGALVGVSVQAGKAIRYFLKAEDVRIGQ